MAFYLNAHHLIFFLRQLKVVWSLCLISGSEGPTLITVTVCVTHCGSVDGKSKGEHHLKSPKTITNHKPDVGNPVANEIAHHKQPLGRVQPRFRVEVDGKSKGEHRKCGISTRGAIQQPTSGC